MFWGAVRRHPNYPNDSNQLSLIGFYIFQKHNSLGLRPNGVSRSPVNGLMVKGSYNYCQVFQGTPPAQKLHAIEYSKSFWQPLELHGSIFWIWEPIGKASNNHDFLESHQNVKKQRISRTWRLMSPFGIKSMTFDFPFGIVFSICLTT